MASTGLTASLDISNAYLAGLLFDFNSAQPGHQLQLWNRAEPITYFFQPGDANSNGTDDWSEFGATAAFQRAFAQFAAVANITFQQVGSAAQANLVEGFNYMPGSPLGASHGYPGVGPGAQATGTYNIGHDHWVNSADNALGSMSYSTILHEIGHGLGLEHPHDNGDFDILPGAVNENALGDNGLNQRIWTVMSYNRGWDGDGSEPLTYGGAGSPMAFDIAALQLLYGANTTYRTGNDVYTLPSANGVGTGYLCIWDAGGIDTISGEGSNVKVTIDLNSATLLNAPGGGGYVSRTDGIFGGYTIAFGAVIENATGGNAADVIYGNGGDNVLIGNNGNDTIGGYDGNDTIIGGGGRDTMNGGLGNDIFSVNDNGNIHDVVMEHAGQGIDTVYSAQNNYVLSANVEVLMIVGGAVNGTGNGLDNWIYGDAGYNGINGGGGNDFMAGGDGDDIYNVDSGSDFVHEIYNNGFGGYDQVQATTSFSLALMPWVEALALISGTVGIGNDLPNQIHGGHPANSGINVLEGRGGNDWLFGYAGNDVLDGGTGADSMIGGAGDDTYYVDNVLDVIEEITGNGQGINDLVYSTVSHTLSWDVELLVLTGTAASNATGNEIYNQLIGNASSNTFDGMGGTDWMSGGGGNDTFVLRKGMTQGDVIADFDGNGPGAGDSLSLVGWGPGAFLTYLSNGSWLIQSQLGNEYFALTNGATLDASDFFFVP